MRSLLFFLGALLVIGVAGCGGEKKSGESAATTAETTQQNQSAAGQLPPADVTAKPGDQIGIEPVTEPLEGLFIKPYFDDAGSEAAKSVAVGQTFSIGVWAETAAPYTTNAAQYRMELPPGVRVTSMSELEAKSVSMGNYADNYQVAYACQPSGRFRLVQYICVAEQGFMGGEVKILNGVDPQGSPFVGFSTCDFQLAPSGTGSAILKKK